MISRKITLLSLLAIIIGIALPRFLDTNIFLSLCPLPLLVGFFRKKYRYLIVVISCLALGFFRAEFSSHHVSKNSLDSYNDSGYIKLIGTVCEEPDRRIKNQKLTICSEKLIKPETKNISGKVLINTDKYPEYFYGDQLQVSGQLETPGEFDTFSYKNYLARYHVYSIIYKPYATKIGTGKHNVIFRYLFDFKKRFEAKLNEIYPEPYGSFMAGLITGSRKGIPKELTEQFTTTGLSHIVAISGYNITILVTVIMALLRSFGKRFAIITSAVTVILFTVAVGASAAVVRACIMGLISLLALNYGRKGDVSIALLMTAAIMITINPKILYFDIGFQLSFLATVGLIYLSPLFEKYTKHIPNLLGLKEGLLLTVSAQITTLPIMLTSFERLSLVAPLSNMLISGPFIPFAMLFGFIAGITGFISIFLAKLIGFIGYVCLSYIIFIVHLSANIPNASVDIFWFNKAFLILYYTSLTWFLYKYWEKAHKPVSPNL